VKDGALWRDTFRPRGHGIRVIPDGVPLASWRPLVPGLTAHGLRHGHRTWMAEDGIPDILAEQRLGHEVPGMRGLYTHVSDRMRKALAQALQARWEDSLRARAAIRPHSPVPLLDELLAPHRRRQADTGSANGTVRHLITRTTPGRQGEVDLPNSSQTA
jgi:Phage integrase family